jgi:hypothetical protein
MLVSSGPMVMPCLHFTAGNRNALQEEMLYHVTLLANMKK